MADPWHLFGLFVLALVAGTIDAMAGGGGLLTVPGLMATGIPPVSALATNKVQAIFSPLSATVHFWRLGRIKLTALWRPAMMSALGAACGAACVSFVDPALLKALVPFLLIGVCGWMLLSHDFGRTPGKQRLPFFAVAFVYVPLIGFYDGFFGPGTGTFFALGMVALVGVSLDQATIEAKLYNLMSNFGALIFFLVKGHIVWPYAIVMACGMVTGGSLGARLVIKHGTGLIRPLLITTSLAMSVRLLWQNGTLAQIWAMMAG